MWARLVGLSGRRVAHTLCHTEGDDAGKALQNWWQYGSIKSESCCGRTCAPQVDGAARADLLLQRRHVLALRTHELMASAPHDAV